MTLIGKPLTDVREFPGFWLPVHVDKPDVNDAAPIATERTTEAATDKTVVGGQRTVDDDLKSTGEIP